MINVGFAMQQNQLRIFLRFTDSESGGVVFGDGADSMSEFVQQRNYLRAKRSAIVWTRVNRSCAAGANGNAGSPSPRVNVTQGMKKGAVGIDDYGSTVSAILGSAGDIGPMFDPVTVIASLLDDVVWTIF